MDKEVREEILTQLQEFKRSKARECLEQEARKQQQVKLKALRVQLKELNSTAAIRTAGELDGFDEGINFLSRVIEKLTPAENKAGEIKSY